MSFLYLAFLAYKNNNIKNKSILKDITYYVISLTIGFSIFKIVQSSFYPKSESGN